MLILGLGFLVFFASFSLHAETLTYSQIAKKALEQSPQFQLTQSALKIAELEYENAFSVFLPSLDLKTQHGWQEDHPTPRQNNWVSATTLTLTENIYDNGESLNRYSLAQLKKDRAQIEFDKSRAEILIRISQVFFDYSLAEIKLKLAKQYQTELDKQYRLASDQFYQGLKTRKDFLRFKSQSQRGNLDLMQAIQNRERAITTLKASLGYDAASEVDFKPIEAPRWNKSDLTLSTPKIPLYDQEIEEKQQRIGDTIIQQTRRDLWPKAYLSASAVHGSSNYLYSNTTWEDGKTTSWNILLTLQWNLLDWGLRRNNVAIEHHRQNMDLRTRQVTTLSTEKEFFDLNKYIPPFLEKYRVAKELHKMEEENFKFLESEYRQGRVSYLELVTALENLLDARNKSSEVEFEGALLALRKKYYQRKLNEADIVE